MLNEKLRSSTDPLIRLPGEGRGTIFLDDSGNVSVKKNDGSISSPPEVVSDQNIPSLKIRGDIYQMTLKTDWANKPSASENPGVQIYVTDVGVNGSYWVSNGLRWNPIQDFTLFSNFYTTVSGGIPSNSITNSEALTLATAPDLVSFIVPAGVMGIKNKIKIEPVFTMPSSAAPDNFVGTKNTALLVNGSSIFNKPRSATETFVAPVAEIIAAGVTTKYAYPFNDLGNNTAGSVGSFPERNLNLEEPFTISARAWFSGFTPNSEDPVLRIVLRSFYIRLIAG